MRFKADNKFTTADEEWVVKESRHERNMDEDYEFHCRSLVTQRAAEEVSECPTQSSVGTSNAVPDQPRWPC